MRLIILLLLLTATIFGSGFWYSMFDTTCDTPRHYRIGSIDSRFGTSLDEVKRIAENATALWEQELSTELFVYDESEKSLPVNFIFDDRQEESDHEAELRRDLETKEGMTENVGVQYEKLITTFRSVKKEYEARVVAYETALKAYNALVTTWNEKGGAPEHIMKGLRDDKTKLENEQAELEILGDTLATIVADLNRIGARGNELITDYNTIVETYNTEFSKAREFAQGDYTGDAINIYQFDSEEELTIVLAHEFGHALSLGHVEGEASLMYHLMEEQTTDDGIRGEDIAEYRRVCIEESSFTRFFRALREAF